MSRGLGSVTLAAQKDPYGVAFDGTKIWVTNADSNSDSKLPAANGLAGRLDWRE
jgi:hypothetical protein